MIALLARLNWRVIAWIGAGLALIALLAGIYLSIRDAGIRQGRAEAEAACQRERDAAADRNAWVEDELRQRAAQLDQATTEQLSRIEVAERTIIQPIREEIQREIRYSSAECALSSGVLDAINAAGSLSGDTTAAGDSK